MERVPPAASGGLDVDALIAFKNSGRPVAEFPGGMLNSVGIPSRGLDFFLQETLPAYTRYRPPTIVSIGRR